MLVGHKIGPFTVDKELGAGAMGAVYRARNVETGERVAIKVIAPGLAANETSMKRFKREADILKQLKHPNIVRLVLTGRFAGTPFYAMEYVEGESLDRVMARRGRISWEEVVALTRQLCGALEHAHDNGIIHRDLKPSNVMVLADGTVKLMDFGIAKDMDVTALTSANCTVGTASYMSPEQCRGERDLTLKSDLYSLGVMFYELVTGQKPFKADNPMDMFMLHVNGKFERPSRLVLDIPVWLDNLICQLLEKKPDQRPLNAAAVAESLDRIKEKVEAQRSAGVDAVKTRTRERQRLEDEDKEAARSLLGKKKKKKKDTPFYRQTWFQAVLYSAGLLGALVVLYFVFLKRPSADTLLSAIEEARKGDLEAKVEARKRGPIAQFLSYYPDHEKARQVKTWANEIDRDKLESDLLRRMQDKDARGVDADETRAREAITQEEAGELDRAQKNWETFLKYKRSADPEKNGYGWLAEDRIKALADVKAEDVRLTTNVTRDGPIPDFQARDEMESKAADALKQELNDPARGRAAWEDFQQSRYRDTRELRRWFLLAALRLRHLPPPPQKKPAEKDKESEAK
jgi:eukaryotic-like serine/threonine-protein kinase